MLQYRNATPSILPWGSRRRGAIGEFEESGGLMLSINEFLELRAVSNVDCNV
jgi:hypothetical protein